MQTNEKKQFQLNPRVLFMLAVVLMALLMPVAMGVYALGLVLGERVISASEQPSVEIEAATGPLRQKLESVAEEKLGGATWASGPLQFTVRTMDPEAEQIRIEAQAQKWGGTTLLSELEGEAKKVLVVLDRDQAEEFLRDGLGEKREGMGSELPADTTRVWVEVMIVKDESS